MRAHGAAFAATAGATGGVLLSAAIFGFFALGSVTAGPSSESSVSTIITAAAGVLPLEAAPAILFFSADAVAAVAGAGSATSSASLICTSTTVSGKPLLLTRVLSACWRM